MYPPSQYTSIHTRVRDGRYMASVLGSVADRSSNKWIGLVAASAGLFLGTLDITVNVALPEITRSFDTDVETVQWIIIFYVGSTTGLQLSLGSAADIYGLKRFYILGLIVYTLAVLLISLAPTLGVVFGFRVLQAVGNGLILASAPALVTRAFPPKERGRALGLMSGLATLGMITGSLGGGVLVDSFGWRSIFIARVPLAAVAIALAFVALRERPSDGLRPPFDLRGGVALFSGLASLILFLTLGGRIGWASPVVIPLAALSAASLGAFAYIERLVPRPVLQLGLLKHRVLPFAVLSAYLMFMASFVNFFILPFYVSDTLGGNAKSLGFLLTLTAVVSAVSAPISGWLSDRISPAYLTTLALAIVAAVLYSFSLLGADSTFADVAFRMAAVGVGMGMFQASNANLVMGSVSADRLGTGAAIMALSRSMGTVTSVAVISAVFAALLSAHTGTLAGEGIVGEAGDAQAFVLTFRDTYQISALLAGVAVVVSLMYWPQLVRRRVGIKRSRPTSG